MKLTLMAVAVAMLAVGCSRDRTVRLGWDPPAVAPDRYRILIDGKVVRDIAPPPLTEACKCLMVAVSVPRGTHTITVVAENARGGASPPSAAVTVR